MQNNVDTIDGITWFGSNEERNSYLRQNGAYSFELEEATDSDKEYMSLLDVIDSKTQIDVYSRSSCGRIVFGYVIMEPNKKYKLPENKTLLESLKTKQIQKRYTEDIENALKEAGVDYQVRYCTSCGGRARKIFYKPIAFTTVEDSTKEGDK